MMNHFLRQRMFILLLSFSSVTAFAPVHRETNPRQSTITLQLSPSEEDYFSLDMKELRQRIDQEYGSYIPIEGPSNRLQLGKRPNQNPDKVHVVIFQPETINQGAHTIEYPKGSGNNVVLAFESIDACRNFAASLAQQNFVDPTPRQYRLQELQNYFSTIGVFVQVIPEGVELKPPRQNVSRFGHNPTLRKTKQYLDYLFAMTDEDLEEMELLESTMYYTTGAWD